MDSNVFGIDIAKQVFQIHWVDQETGEIHLDKVKRKDFVQYFANQQPSMTGIETCGGAHHWGRLFEKMGHTVKLLPAKKVKPFVVGNKNDVVDARAIWTAMQQPDMKFIAEQQAILGAHRMQELLVKHRTAQINSIRGLLTEFGLVMPKGKQAFKEQLPDCLTQLEDRAPRVFMCALQVQVERLAQLDDDIKQLEKQIQSWFKHNEDCQRIAKVPGIGPLTATALIASMGDVSAFKSSREFAAWIGMVPRQTGTGGRVHLHGISKRGDVYLRTLLIHGERAVMSHSKEKSEWLVSLPLRRPKNVVTVALANKIARTVWALVANQTSHASY
ncbi:IS110 family transposase [Vibrio sp. Isolate23]|uniref:IS110 family transposase n=1 Tax=Vibrio sp. Isolate23 TaxID=2908533 RepID=UPI001EFDE760|nr:IS110 family transposase [Vibrio sp. Isolate23]MCG9682878.1 IS110 family transposase [Vibrio sp. Isolate23]